jgi:TNF receptor-associated factor 4
MQLRAVLNGLGKTAVGTHISVYYSIIKGAYDATNAWPFPENVKITLLPHGEGCQDHFRLADMSLEDRSKEDNLKYFGKPTALEAKHAYSYGYTKFVRKDKVAGHVNNNTLCFKVSIVSS